MQSVKRYVFIGGGAVLIIGIVVIIAAAIFGQLLNLLYIILMILAILMIAATLFQVYSIVALIRAINTVRDEMKPLMASVQETVGVVKDTARTAGNTVSTVGATTRLAQEFALGPSVKVAAAAVAAQQMARVFLGRGQTRSRAELRRRQQMEAAAVVRGKE